MFPINNNAFEELSYIKLHELFKAQNVPLNGIVYRVVNKHRLDKYKNKSELLSNILINEFNWNKKILEGGSAQIDISDDLNKIYLQGNKKSYKVKILL